MSCRYSFYEMELKGDVSDIVQLGLCGFSNGNSGLNNKMLYIIYISYSRLTEYYELIDSSDWHLFINTLS